MGLRPHDFHEIVKVVIPRDIFGVDKDSGQQTPLVGVRKSQKYVLTLLYKFFDNILKYYGFLKKILFF